MEVGKKYDAPPRAKNEEDMKVKTMLSQIMRFNVQFYTKAVRAAHLSYRGLNVQFICLAP
jgi:hypothetical protein